MSTPAHLSLGVGELVLAAPDQIGDTLLATPAIRSWKLAHPAGRITVRCRDTGGPYQVLMHNRYVDNLRVLDDREASRLPGLHVRLAPQFALSLGYAQGRSFAWGYGRLLQVEIDSLAYDYAIMPDERNAAGELSLALSSGAPIVVVARHSVSCTSNDPHIAEPNKCVDNTCWLHCADDLIRRGYVPVAVGSREEARDPRFERWPGPRVYGESLRVVAALCARSAGVLTIDNGIRHLAAAAGAHLYTLSARIPLGLISCVPVREGQRIHEEHIALHEVDAETLVRGARRIGL